MFYILALLLSFASLFADENASISMYAINMGTGEVLIDQEGDRSLIPSSCMKIVTIAAALHLLDPQESFHTNLEYDGTIDREGVLHGNLYIRGDGDPCLGSDRIASSPSWQKQLEVWRDVVSQSGIKKILGKVIGDASKWEKALAVPSWSWEDLGNYYGAGACALSFHENYYSLYFKPAEAVGEAAGIARTDPALSNLTFQNEVTTGPVGSGDRACIYGSEFSPIQYVRGTVPAGVSEFVIKGAIPDPSTYCASLLTKALRDRGISIEEREQPKQGRKVLHTTDSPPISEIIYWTNQKSINLYAEHLLKKIGETVYHEGSTQAGTRAIVDFLRSQNIDTKGFNMADGSGLSRKNLITAKQLVTVLQKMKKSPHFPIFLRSLPQNGDLIHAKSGAMSLIKTYAGYAGDIAFAILINQCLDTAMMNDKIQLFLSDLKTKR